MNSANTYSVYMHLNKKNGKRYIGITKQDPVLRWGYRGLGYSHCPKFWRAIQKYGWESFDHVVLMTLLPQDIACAAETYLIKLFATQDDRFGYNVADGGLVHLHSEETKEKIRLHNTGKVLSEETKEKIRQARAKQDFDWTP